MPNDPATPPAPDPATPPSPAPAPPPAPDPGAPPATPPAAPPATPPAPVTPAAVDWDKARETLPEELREHPSLKPYSSFENLVRSHVDQARLLGKRASEMTPDELAVVDSRYQAPATPEAYEIKLDPALKLPEGAKVDPRRETWARGVFHKLHVPQRLAQGLFNEVVAMQAQEMAETQTRLKNENADAEARLRAQTGGRYDQVVANVTGFIRKFGGDEFADYLDRPGADGKRPGNDPFLLMAIDRMMQAVGEDSLAGGGRAGFEKTPAEAQARIDEIKADKAWMDADHPQHKALVAEEAEMRKIIVTARNRASAAT